MSRGIDGVADAVSLPVRLVLFGQVRPDTPVNRAKVSERDGQPVLATSRRAIATFSLKIFRVVSV
jgi:hypothetical protein